ncbi:branched-chain amino acid transaminase [Chloroflexota bacterium]
MPPYAFFRGQFMPASEAKVGIMTHALHYGTGTFEGIRGNWNQDTQQVYLFRVQEHYERLLKSCRIVKINIPYSVDELCRLTAELVEKSGYHEDVYVRPLAYKSSEVLGVRLHNLEDDFCLMVTTFPAYLDDEKGVRVCVSSWKRLEDNMIPARAKICGLYVNNALAKTEAIENGYDEAIMLTAAGYVSEGSGENIFLVEDKTLVTPPASDSILVGITRDTVIQLARNELGLETLERHISRSELYLADECFLTGTAAHVTPVLEIDHRKVGRGDIGEITQKLRALYFSIIQGRNEKYFNWCLPTLTKTVKA